VATSDRIKLINLFGALVMEAQERDIKFIITHFHRTAEEQNLLYQQGRTKPGNIVTYLDGYEKKSKHQLWQAVDIAIIGANGDIDWESDNYEVLGSYWKSLGGIWGGDFTALDDRGHFEV
jgi:peptidoglycan L-alanyl-D-glutamate endopeptidase CwlK